MTHPDGMARRLISAKILYLTDFIDGHWQFPLDRFQQECLSFHASIEVFSPTSVSRGAMICVLFLQSNKEILFAHLDALIGLDDILRYAENSECLLNTLEIVLLIYGVKDLKVISKDTFRCI